MHDVPVDTAGRGKVILLEAAIRSVSGCGGSSLRRIESQFESNYGQYDRSEWVG